MLTGAELRRAFEILLVEDSHSDAGLTILALKQTSRNLAIHHVEDGVEAMAYLRQQEPYQNRRMPDLVLLDLNMPRKDGREVLREVRNDERFAHLPIVVLTTSTAELDVLTAYGLHSNAYLQKPIDLQHFKQTIAALDQFFLTHVVLPTSE